MTTSRSLSLIADRLEIIQLTARYAYLVDIKNLDLLMELWGDNDPVFDEEAFGLKRITGKNEIRNFVQSEIFGHMEALCHLTTNHIIEEITDSTATGTCTVLFEGDVSDGGGHLRATGFYEDQYVRENGMWKFSSRKVNPLTAPQFSELESTGARFGWADR
jgi:hypothetical protein